jgi:hypothetical protein
MWMEQERTGQRGGGSITIAAIGVKNRALAGRQVHEEEPSTRKRNTVHKDPRRMPPVRKKQRLEDPSTRHSTEKGAQAAVGGRIGK